MTFSISVDTTHSFGAGAADVADRLIKERYSTPPRQWPSWLTSHVMLTEMAAQMGGPLVARRNRTIPSQIDVFYRVADDFQIRILGWVPPELQSSVLEILGTTVRDYSPQNLLESYLGKSITDTTIAQISSELAAYDTALRQMRAPSLMEMTNHRLGIPPA